MERGMIFLFLQAEKGEESKAEDGWAFYHGEEKQKVFLLRYTYLPQEGE